MKAFLKNYRQSPRKVRLVVDLVRGKEVEKALQTLTFVNKRAALPIEKLIRGAVANAQSTGADTSKLFITKITVDKGVVMKRFMPRARGAAARINKRSSHITLELGNSLTKKVKSSKSKVTTN